MRYTYNIYIIYAGKERIEQGAAGRERKEAATAD